MIASTAPFADLDDLLSDRLAEHRVPGAVVGVLDGDEQLVRAGGTTRAVDGTPVRPETMFQVGSITKVVTATLVMQLVAESVVGLDDPVVDHLPGLVIGGDRDATGRVTVRHLLSHAAGVEGDYFADFGRGEDALARYVDSLAGISFAAEPGRYFSYCNSGFVVLGRLLEVTTGRSFDAVLRERLLQPLGLDHSVTSADEAVLRSTAVGHDADDDGWPRVAARWSIFPALAPAGATLTMSAPDVLGFARLHSDSRSAEFERLLPTPAARAMRELQQPLPGEVDHYMGLGWGCTRLGDRLLLSHSGSTLGQHSLLHVVPDTGQAVVVLTNGARGAVLADEVARTVIERLLGRSVPKPPPAPDPPVPVDPGSVTGHFGCLGLNLTVAPSADGVLTAVVRELVEDGSGLGAPTTFGLVGRTDSELVGLAPDGSLAFDLVVLERDEADRATVLHGLGRVLSRRDES